LANQAFWGICSANSGNVESAGNGVWIVGE
jgi:hypothetical protein